MKPTEKQCLGCAEISQPEAHVCKHCGQHYWKPKPAQNERRAAELWNRGMAWLGRLRSPAPNISATRLLQLLPLFLRSAGYRQVRGLKRSRRM